MDILWTDWLVYILVLSLGIVSFILGKKSQLHRPIQYLANSKSGMLSLVVLLFFVGIGLLDSIHFKHTTQRLNNEMPSQEMVSLLDYWATPLREHVEKTYSAPFATHLYNKEIIIAKNGLRHWTYPRLEYGGKHLTHPATQKKADIALKASMGFLKGCGIYVLFLGLRYYISRSTKICLPTATCKAVCGLLFILCTGSGMVIELSAHYHILGTDKVGEDVFYQAIKGVRTGLVIGSLTTLVMLPFAIVFGIMAGFFQGWIDDLITYLYTTLNSIPSVLLIAASILMVQVYMANHPDDFTNPLLRADMRLLFLCLILGVTSWTGLCRLLRAETLKLREMEYVQAARALGVTQSMILFRHILPNVMHIVLISVVLDFSSLVLAEAVLSYINIGVDPTTYSWGNMINGARLEMAREPVVWWSLTASFVFMFSLVLAANLFADCVRDAFDPRRKI